MLNHHPEYGDRPVKAVSWRTTATDSRRLRKIAIFVTARAQAMALAVPRATVLDWCRRNLGKQ